MMFVIEFFLSIFIAVIIGRLVSKLKLPSILGWLIAGMILGPHALSLLNQQLLDATYYNRYCDNIQWGDRRYLSNS